MKITIPFLFVLVTGICSAQSSYTLADYAATGDTIYLTKAQLTATTFDTTGTGIIWNYASLTGNGQTALSFRAPNQTGFGTLQWPYIYNSNNVNLSSTDGQTIAFGNYEETNPNDYFLKSQNTLQQKASSFDIVINGFSLSIKNVYTSADYLYRFPVNYGNTDSSNAAYATNIPGIYYNQTQLKRVNTVVGWGTVITPYGTFTNALKFESIVNERDSIVLNDTFTQIINTVTREYQWLDPSKPYPILDVKQLLTGNIYITQSIQYYDHRQYFQPSAHFAYLPLMPAPGDTVSFQNLSTNSYGYSWNFGDTASAGSDSSVVINPVHIFNSPGVYKATLIAFNGPLSDTSSLNITVADTGSAVVPVAYFTYSPASPFIADTVSFQNLSSNSSTYLWNFGDAASAGKDSSRLNNPVHIFSSPGVYKATLIAFRGSVSDTSSLNITVADTVSTVVPVANFTYSPVSPFTGDTVSFQNLSSNSSTYLWNFGDVVSGTADSSTALNPVHIYTTVGTYTVTLVAFKGLKSDTVSLHITVNAAVVPVANFTYSPASPFTGDTVSFQNLSSNSSTYFWNFGDVVSGTADSSTALNPAHIYTAAGTYTVTLIAFKGLKSDTVSLHITVNAAVVPVANFTYSPASPFIGDTVSFQNLSSNSSTYFWNFGDVVSGTADSSTALNPIHIYNTAGTYTVTLFAFKGLKSDTISLHITVNAAVVPVANFTYSPALPFTGDTVSFQNLSTNSSTYLWNFGDVVSGTADSSTASDPVHIYTTAGTYTVTLFAFKGLKSDTVSLSITVTDTTSIATGVLATQVAPLQVFPNPATSKISISDRAQEQIQIFDLTGKCLLTLRSQGVPFDVDIESLPPVFLVHTESGAVKMVVKQE